MRQLRDDTHLILDGEVRVYRRERSKRWQAAFVIDGHTIRISTGKRDLAEAKEYARDTFLEYKFRHKNDLPVVTKKFSDVAKLAIADMRKQLDAGLGRKVFADYGQARLQAPKSRGRNELLSPRGAINTEGAARARAPGSFAAEAGHETRPYHRDHRAGRLISCRAFVGEGL